MSSSFSILLVDGYDTSREALVAELRRRGLEVHPAAEEEEAVRLAQKEPTITAIVLDLPLGEAVEAARALRRTRTGALVLAFLDPGRVSAPERDAARAQGIDHFLLRPCPAAEIVKQLARLLVRVRARPM